MEGGRDRFCRTGQRVAFYFRRMEKKREKKYYDHVCNVRARDARLDTCNFGRASAHARLCLVYTVHNNEEFAQTGIPTFFKQREARTNMALYGWMDKHDVCVRTRSFVRSLARSFARSFVHVHVVGSALNRRERDAVYLYRYEKCTNEESSLPFPPPPLRKLSTITLAQQAP